MATVNIFPEYINNGLEQKHIIMIDGNTLTKNKIKTLIQQFSHIKIGTEYHPNATNEEHFENNLFDRTLYNYIEFGQSDNENTITKLYEKLQEICPGDVEIHCLSPNNHQIDIESNGKFSLDGLVQEPIDLLNRHKEIFF